MSTKIELSSFPVLSDHEFFHATFTNQYGESALFGYNYADGSSYVWHSDIGYIKLKVHQIHGMLLLVPVDPQQAEPEYKPVMDGVSREEVRNLLVSGLKKRCRKITPAEIELFLHSVTINSLEAQIVCRLHDLAKTLVALKKF